MRYRLVRHLAAILLLPFTVTVVIPWWILSAWHDADTRWTGWLEVPGTAAGLLIGTAGLLLCGWCVTLFARVGQGTLAPWDPTHRLVAVGPYSRMRNPMISGVAAVLAGQALVFGSVLLAAWMAGFVLLNHAFFILVEEPGLERRFGAAYADYRTRVPRWLPRSPRT